MIDVKGRWALITGAARGIGYGAALFMAKQGCNLVLHGRTAAHCDKVLSEVKALGVETKRSENITVSFKVGDSVEVTGGSFEGFIGKVEKIDLDAQTADVLVSMFGRETSVTLPLTQVKPEA